MNCLAERAFLCPRAPPYNKGSGAPAKGVSKPWGGSNRKFLGGGVPRARVEEPQGPREVAYGKGVSPPHRWFGMGRGLGLLPENFWNLCLKMAIYPAYLRILKG